ncbi:MAG: putative serine/threonine protein kinase [Nocardia sp.]|uniref:serine/threonine-protein kinase n=1 Tax=Nocardia sp. TaxID=1821 RepID=UPI00345120CC|nr:putative serine/threonine protein kinase [Nocardia sp.]
MLNNGDVFAGFTIERLLGQGGMGSVYLARHPRLGRLTALKLLNRELFADREIRIRFNREADLVAQLDHPNIVEVYDRGTEDEQLWISMQYIDGVDAAGVDVTMLPPERAVQIIEGVAAALDYAHTMGVLHRDVKPANIILARAVGGHGERVFLTDFGIARLREDSTHLTQRGMFTATLAYASPEQMTGAHLDHTTDQYSLACALYWLLIGAGPFDSPDPSELIRGHLQLLPPPVSLRRPGLTPAMDAVITKGMAKRPMDRFPSCTEFAKAARRALTASPGQSIYPNQPAPQPSSPPGYAAVPPPYAAPPAGYPAAPPPYSPGPVPPQGYPATYQVPPQGYPAGYPAPQQPALAPQQPALAPQQPVPAPQQQIPNSVPAPHPQGQAAHTSHPNTPAPQLITPPAPGGYSSDPANPQAPQADASSQPTDVVPQPIASPAHQEPVPPPAATPPPPSSQDMYSQPTDSFPTPRVPSRATLSGPVTGADELQPASTVAPPADPAARSDPKPQVPGADTRLSCATDSESPPDTPPQPVSQGSTELPSTSLGARPADPAAGPKHAARVPSSDSRPSTAPGSEPGVPPQPASSERGEPGGPPQSVDSRHGEGGSSQQSAEPGSLESRISAEGGRSAAATAEVAASGGSAARQRAARYSATGVPEPAEGESNADEGSLTDAVGAPNAGDAKSGGAPGGSVAESAAQDSDTGQPQGAGSAARAHSADEGGAAPGRGNEGARAEFERAGFASGAVDPDSVLTADSPVVAAGVESNAESAGTHGVEGYPGVGLRHPRSGAFVPAGEGVSGGSEPERTWARGAATGSEAAGVETTGSGMPFGSVESTGQGPQFSGPETTGPGSQFARGESAGPQYAGVEGAGVGPQFPAVEGAGVGPQFAAAEGAGPRFAGVENTGRGFGPPSGYPVNSGAQQQGSGVGGVERSQVAALVVLGVAVLALVLLLAIVVVQVAG